MISKNRRKRVFANKMHRDTFLMIFFLSLLPLMLMTVALYYLIFQITAEQFAIPEAIAYNLIPAARKVTAILFVSTPALVLLLMIVAYKATHQIVGPFDRIVRELDERLRDHKKDPIGLRKNDKFRPLVDRINNLLERMG